MTNDSFRQRVYRIVEQIPRGKVTNYGQISLLIGSPRSARQVGYALRALGIQEQKIPWWRVINKSGEIRINQNTGGLEKEIQRDLLLAEGVKFIKKAGSTFFVDLEKCSWQYGFPSLSSVDYLDSDIEE